MYIFVTLAAQKCGGGVIDPALVSSGYPVAAVGNAYVTLDNRPSL